MTVFEAKKIVYDYYEKTNSNKEDNFLFTEALSFLIEETKDPRYMTELGAYYYGKKQFDLALKYYDMASECNDIYATLDLGYIWYYGRTGEKNYEKAFHYYSKAKEMSEDSKSSPKADAFDRRVNGLIASYKIADMYKNGYYVEQDYKKYREIIEDLYPKVEGANNLGEPLPEIFTRLAKIRAEDGEKEEAIYLYERARDFLEQRIRYNAFFGDLTIMKWLIKDYYDLVPFDKDYILLYDLYYALKEPCKVKFIFEGEEHEVESLIEDGVLVVRFDDNWYRSIYDFFAKATVNDTLLTTRYQELIDFEVIE